MIQSVVGISYDIDLAEAIEDVLIGQDPGMGPFFGFNGYGKIAPFSIDAPARFHNGTCVIVALSSRES